MILGKFTAILFFVTCLPMPIGRCQEGPSTVPPSTSTLSHTEFAGENNQSQANDPNKPADPSLSNFNKPNPDYRGQRPPGTASDASSDATTAPALPPPPAPNPLPPSPVKGLFPSNKIFDQLASGGPMKGMLDVEKVATQLPSGAELLVQNITVVLPGYTGPLEGLANGLVPHGSSGPYQYPRTFFFDPISYGPRGNSLNPGYIGPLSPFEPPLPDSLPIIVNPEWLSNALQANYSIRLVDATHAPQDKPDPKQFKSQYYAQWDRLLTDKGNVDYQKAHIPSAVHFNLDIGTFPSWNERESLYPPELFEQYVQRLGINANEHIVVYSRGPLGGMLYAARVWSLFRIYGHNRVSILNGGFEAWQSVNLPVDDAAVEITPGTWTARFDPTQLITYEEMTTPASDGYCVLSRLYWYNFLDARTRNEFFGYAGNRVDGARGNHVPGTKSFPASELVQPDGRFVPIPEIKKRLQHIAYAPEKQSIVAGTSPEEASMVLVALALMGDLKARLFNGGIEEIRIRAPQLISE